MVASVNSRRFSRNYGFWSEEEQAAINSSRVAIGGVGGDGFQLGLKLARMGVGSFSVADPETFEAENVNRVEGAATSTLGRLKVEVFRERLLDINPAAHIEIWRDGVHAENVEAFMADADLVFDESELTRPEVGTTIARQARKQGIPDVLVMNVGFAAQVMSFDPRSAWTFERFMGLPPEGSLEEIASMVVDLSRCLPYIPPYADLRTLASLQASDDDMTVSLPSISVGVDVASAIGSAQAFLHLTSAVSVRRPRPVWAPHMAYVDAYSMRAKVIRASRLTHLRNLGVAMIRHQMRLNPPTAYTRAEISARIAATEY